jgi:hypothetical protein
MSVQIGGAEYDIRPCRPTDEPAIIELHRTVFGDDGATARAEREWRFHGNPAGEHRTTLCLSEDGTVVCAYTGIPMRGQLLGEPATLGLIVDTMTHPACRGAVLGRRGVLVRTAQLWAETFGAGDISFVYGVPQERIARLGELLIGYRLWDDLSPYSRWIRRPLVKRVRGRLAERNIIEVDRFGPEADDLWERLSGDYPTAVIRDSTYLSWRYRDGPRKDYVVLAMRLPTGEWSGWLVLAIRDGVGVIVDALLPPDVGSAGRLLAVATGRSVAGGARYLEGWATENSHFGRVLTSSGFTRGQQVGTRFAARVLIPVEEDAIRRSLYIQPGDTDEI